MHLSKISIINYRNFSNAKFMFFKGINTIIGENGSGKTNLFRAIRLLLDDSMKRSATRMSEGDFFRGIGDWRGHWIIISLEFDEVSQDEAIQALFVHGTGNINVQTETVQRATYNLIFRPNSTIRMQLAQIEAGDMASLQTIRDQILIEDYETIITGRSEANFNDPDVYNAIVGNFETAVFSNEIENPDIGGRVPAILSLPSEISFTYVQALRDVISEFHNNRTNPLLNLLKNKSDQINQEEFGPIVAQVDTLNSSIEALTDVNDVRKDIKNTVNDTVGDAFSPKTLSIRSGLSNEAEQLFQSLKLFISESDDGYEGAIHEMSLGGANLIYLTLKLLEFKYQTKKQPIANFLLIEEPEAHIHTHIQKSLFDKIKYPNTQVIYSTHSSHISEASNIRSVNVIGKVKGIYHVFQPATGLSEPQVESIQRYLDAVRSNLLFAKSVMLVEGDAEEILVPVLVKKVIGISLDELGISLVNIRSTGFENISLLFHENRIRKKCSIITDLDATFFDTTEIPNDTETIISEKRKAVRSAALGATRRINLDTLCQNNPWIKACYAPHTFEVDLLGTNNSAMYVSALNDVYVDASTIETARSELQSNDISVYGRRALTMANNVGKGWFAIKLGRHVSHLSEIPPYILDAIVFAHNVFGKEIICNILDYRLAKIAVDLAGYRELLVNTTGQPSAWYADGQAYITAKEDSLPILSTTIQNYKSGQVALEVVLQIMRTHFPENPIIALLERL